jgi:hypothetical protein
MKAKRLCQFNASVLISLLKCVIRHQSAKSYAAAPRAAYGAAAGGLVRESVSGLRSSSPPAEEMIGSGRTESGMLFVRIRLKEFNTM